MLIWNNCKTWIFYLVMYRNKLHLKGMKIVLICRRLMKLYASCRSKWKCLFYKILSIFDWFTFKIVFIWVRSVVNIFFESANPTALKIKSRLWHQIQSTLGTGLILIFDSFQCIVCILDWKHGNTRQKERKRRYLVLHIYFTVDSIIIFRSTFYFSPLLTM